MTERTLVLIKPDGVQRQLVGRILARYEERGLKIVGLKLVQVDRDLAERHYAAHREKPFFGGLVDFITSAPLVAARARRARTRSPSSARSTARPGRTRRPRARSAATSRSRPPRTSSTRRTARRRPTTELALWFDAGRAARLRARHRPLGARARRLSRSGRRRAARRSARGRRRVRRCRRDFDGRRVRRRRLGDRLARRASLGPVRGPSPAGRPLGRTTRPRRPSAGGSPAAAAGPPKAPAGRRGRGPPARARRRSAVRPGSRATPGRSQPAGRPRRAARGRAARSARPARRRGRSRPTTSRRRVVARRARACRGRTIVASGPSRASWTRVARASQAASPGRPMLATTIEHEREPRAGDGAPSRGGRDPAASERGPGRRRPRRRRRYGPRRRRGSRSGPAPRPRDRGPPGQHHDPGVADDRVADDVLDVVLDPGRDRREHDRCDGDRQDHGAAESSVRRSGAIDRPSRPGRRSRRRPGPSGDEREAGLGHRVGQPGRPGVEGDLPEPDRGRERHREIGQPEHHRLLGELAEVAPDPGHPSDGQRRPRWRWRAALRLPTVAPVRAPIVTIVSERRRTPRRPSPRGRPSGHPAASARADAPRTPGRDRGHVPARPAGRRRRGRAPHRPPAQDEEQAEELGRADRGATDRGDLVRASMTRAVRTSPTGRWPRPTWPDGRASGRIARRSRAAERDDEERQQAHRGRSADPVRLSARCPVDRRPAPRPSAGRPPAMGSSWHRRRPRGQPGLVGGPRRRWPRRVGLRAPQTRRDRAAETRLLDGRTAARPGRSDERPGPGRRPVEAAGASRVRRDRRAPLGRTATVRAHVGRGWASGRWRAPPSSSMRTASPPTVPGGGPAERSHDAGDGHEHARGQELLQGAGCRPARPGRATRRRQQDGPTTEAEDVGAADDWRDRDRRRGRTRRRSPRPDRAAARPDRAALADDEGRTGRERSRPAATATLLWPRLPRGRLARRSTAGSRPGARPRPAPRARGWAGDRPGTGRRGHDGQRRARRSARPAR